jgi:hypothetical protein
MNEIIAACTVTGKRGRKTLWNKYSVMKREWTDRVACLAAQQKFPRIKKDAHFLYVFMERTKRRDPSNFISGGIKIIEDGLQACDKLPNDNWKYVASIETAWAVDKINPGCMLSVWYEEEDV